MRRLAGILLIVLMLCVGSTTASAQTAPEPPATGAGTVGVLSGASMRLGTQVAAECGSDGYPAAPYGDGLGFLHHGEQLHWRIAGDFAVDMPSIYRLPRPRSGRFDLCGVASVPPGGGVPEVGTAGPCDSVEASGGRGLLVLPDAPESWTDPPRVSVAVRDVGWPSAGSVIALTGTIPGSAEQEPGKLFMLLQRRTHGMCAHRNHEATRVSTTYPQGGTSAELVGVVAYQLPRATASNTACEDHWGKVRRHLGGAGAGLECPVPPAI